MALRKRSTRRSRTLKRRRSQTRTNRRKIRSKTRNRRINFRKKGGASAHAKWAEAKAMAAQRARDLSLLEASIGKKVDKTVKRKNVDPRIYDVKKDLDLYVDAIKYQIDSGLDMVSLKYETKENAFLNYIETNIIEYIQMLRKLYN